MSKSKSKWLILFCTVLFMCALGFASPASAACIDTDGDGYGSPGDATCPKGSQTDCNDNDNKVYPGATEICDGKDTNCDGYRPATDVNNDNDNYPQCAGDCNDNNATVYPGAPELCDGLDNNCDYSIPLNERDADADGYRTCGVPADCNDNNRFINPGMQEWCSDTKDNNCNTQIDESPCICPDADSDGFTASYCGGTDCNDIDNTVYPGAPELCTDGKDNNCNGLKDCADPGAINCPAITDADGDGYDVAGICGTADCDDNDPKVYPGAAEICDGKDSNCDGWKAPTDIDADGDGVPLCASDCNDNDPNRFPGNLEHALRNTCNDFIDNDCDNLTDATDPDCTGSCVTASNPKQGPHFVTLLNPDNTVHPDNSALSCGKCHGTDWQDPISFACQRCHADPADTSDPLNGTTKAQYPLNAPYGFGSAPNVSTHTTWTLGDRGCVTCHNPHTQEQNNLFGTTYGKYIKEYICYDSKGIQEFIEFTSNTGPGSFADGAPYSANICNTCHTTTNHQQNDGTAPGGQDHNNGQDCMTCHSHSGGFAPIGGAPAAPHNTAAFSNNCDYCHVTPTDYITPVPDSKCAQCHTPSGSLKGSFPTAPNVVTHQTKACVGCHQLMTASGNLKLLKRNLSGVGGGTNIIFTALTGTGSFADGPPYMENVCDSCHTMTNHHQNDGTAPGGQDHNNGSNCTTCHPHGNGFIAEIWPDQPHNSASFLNVNNCSYCHVSNSDFTTKIPDTKCSQCHTPSGALKVANPAEFGLAPNVVTHNTANGSGAYTYSNDCVDCHDVMFPQTNVQHIRSTLTGSIVPGSTITFTAFSGPGSFADGPPYPENVCNTCHSQTQHHQSDGSAPGGQDHNNSTDCAECHPHAGGFKPVAGCANCHDKPQPNGTGDYRRQVAGAGGEIGNASTKASHHVNGTLNDATCSVCHDQSNHKLNVDPGVKLNNPDGGTAISYTGTASQLTTFCVNCHDSGGAAAYGGLTPFSASSDNTTPPNVKTPWTLSYNHSTGAGCMNCHGNSGGTAGLTTNPTLNGHASNTANMLIKTTEYGVCMQCHNAAITKTNTASELAMDSSPFSPAGTTVYRTKWNSIPNVQGQFATANLAHHAVLGAGKNQPANTLNANWNSSAGRKIDNATACPDGTCNGLDNNFVDGWESTSLVTCTDCHGNGSTGARGPHGSNQPWVLKGMDKTTAVKVTLASGTVIYPNQAAPNLEYINAVFCVNCHRADIHGWSSGETPRDMYAELSRFTHYANGGDGQTQAEGGKGGYSNIGCKNCHGGGEVAGIHGSNRGVGSIGTSTMGRRFMNGNSWAGQTSSGTSLTCYTGTPPAIGVNMSGCSGQHSGGKGGTLNYSY